MRRTATFILMTFLWVAAGLISWWFYSAPREVEVQVLLNDGSDLYQLVPHSWRALTGIALPLVGAGLVSVFVLRRIRRVSDRTT